jgi:hypothetical protein
MFGFFKKRVSSNNDKKDDFDFTCYTYSFNNVLYLRDLINILNLEYESITAEVFERTKFNNPPIAPSASAEMRPTLPLYLFKQFK